LASSPGCMEGAGDSGAGTVVCWQTATSIGDRCSSQEQGEQHSTRPWCEMGTGACVCVYMCRLVYVSAGWAS
jgi:hypothetical protein